MKKLITTLLLGAALSISSPLSTVAYAWNAGFCLVLGCNCHQYVGTSGPCGNCGHEKVRHS